MKHIVLLVLGFMLYLEPSMACRFTVREIGFSTLSQDIYTFVVLDKNADASDVYWEKIRARLHDANIRLSVLHPDIDKEHPLMKKIKVDQVSLPSYLLISPDGRQLSFDDTNQVEIIVDNLLESPVRRAMSGLFPGTFAVVLWIEGEKDELKEMASIKIKEACEQIQNVMPHMPKQVRHGPEIVRMKKEDILQERVLLWALGYNAWPTDPKAVVFYGRGRMMGGVLEYRDILKGELFKYMSMIGADCECGLDRKWMLGNQIPLLWSAESQQELADEVGFDVDNPMILAEMSRILAKETQQNAASGISFGPETISLSELMGDSSADVPQHEKEKSVWLNLMYVLCALIIVIGAVSYFLYTKRKND